MGQFNNFEANDSVKNDGDKSQARTGSDMSNQNFNDDFRKTATAGAAMLSEFAFPASKDLL